VKIALIGYGAMGALVARLATAATDEVGITISSQHASLNASQLAELLRGHDVAIDFSIASAVWQNVEACALAAVPLVEGTTGWQKDEADVRRSIAEYKGALVFGANFSVGVNVFYRIVSEASRLMTGLHQYQAFMEEEHHARKRDAPSGTALLLKNLMNEHLQTDIPITSVRAGYIPGTHSIGFDSEADQIRLTHTARSREGFAAGALLAARWVMGRQGVYEFSDVLDQMIQK
jgi:4-hydroxy-tetrahydrodipicolinate reductase